MRVKILTKRQANESVLHSMFLYGGLFAHKEGWVGACNSGIFRRHIFFSLENDPPLVV